MRFLLALLLLASSLAAQDAAPAPESTQPDDQEWLQKEVVLEQIFRHPPDRFAALLFNRIDTVKVNGFAKVRYSLTSAGLEPGKPYLFMAWELGADAPHLLLPAVEVDKKGILHCSPENQECPGGPGSEVNVALSDKPGQPSRFVIADEDQKPIALGEVIPNPSTVTDHDCSLETVLLRPDATITLVMGQGFEPGEDIKVISTSFDEHVANAGKATGQGAYQTVLLPFANDHDSGETMVTMNSSRCELSTHFAWGAPNPATPAPAVAEGASPQPTEPPAADSETVIAPVRTATDQIERALEHITPGPTPKKSPPAGPAPDAAPSSEPAPETTPPAPPTKPDAPEQTPQA